jgi:hypothetical protein
MGEKQAWIQRFKIWPLPADFRCFGDFKRENRHGRAHFRRLDRRRKTPFLIARQAALADIALVA